MVWNPALAIQGGAQLLVNTALPTALPAAVQNTPPPLDSFAQTDTATLPEQNQSAGLRNTSKLFASIALGMQGSASTPAPDDDVLFQRVIQRSREELYFKYGKLDPQHPAQQWLEKLAQRLPVKNGFKPEFILLPDWKEINALSYPDGTIFIGRGIIKFAENEEALLGVMAHEYVHAYREHVAKTREAVQEGSFIDRAIHSFGLRRMHEYEADIRGALEILEGGGVSPLAFKELLEKLHKLEERRNGKDLAHGSSMERALNIATATHLLDLKSIASVDWKPIPVAIIESCQAPEGKEGHTAIVNPIRFHSSTEEEAEQNRQKRTEAIRQLPIEKLPLAAQILLKRTDPSLKKVAEDSSDKEALAQVLERMSLALFAEETDPKQRLLKTFSYLELFSGTHFLVGWRQIIGSPFAKPEDWLTSAQDMEVMRQALEEAPQRSPWRFTEKETAWFWDQLLYFVFEKKILNPQEWQPFVLGWSETLAKISAQFDRQKIRAPRDFQEIAVRNLLHSDMFTSQKRRELAALFKTASDDTATEEEIRALGKKIALASIYKLQEDHSKIAKGLLKILGGKPSLPELGRALTLLMNEMEMTQLEKGIDRETEVLTAVERYAHRILALWILKDSFQDLSTEGKFSQKEKDRILLVTAFHLDAAGILETTQNDLKELKPEAPSSRRDAAEGFYRGREQVERTEAIRRELEKILNPRSLNKDDINEDDILFLYKNLYDAGIYEKNIGARPRIIAPETLTPYENNEASFVFLVVRFLISKSPMEMAHFLQRWDEAGFAISALLADHPQYCGPLAVKLAEFMEGDALDGITPKYLLKMGRWIANPFLGEAFQRYVKSRFWRALSFEEKLDILFPPQGEEGIWDSDTREEFLEKEVRTKAQYDAVRTRLETSLEELLTRGRVGAGLIAVTQINLMYRDVTPFLKALLTTHRSDAPLKGQIYDFLHGLGESPEDPEEIIDLVQNADAIIRLLMSLNPLGKQILLRKILVGDGGGLIRRDRKEALFDMLFGNWVETKRGEENLFGVLQEVKTALVAAREWELLYFALQSTLKDQIAIPPNASAQIPWSQISVVEDDLSRTYDKPEPLTAQRLKKILWKEPPPAAWNNPEKHAVSFLRYSEMRLHSALESKGYLDRPTPKPMTSLRFVKEMASRAGAMGVRFLQQIPLIVETLPEEQEEEFMEVYDQVKGQSKLAALLLLQREWPEVWDEIEEVGERIGGGSIVTVYKARRKDGGEEVIKVRNPNITYHIQEMYRLASQVLDDLSARHNGAYSAARELLDDIKEWLEKDIGFEGFLEQDRAFKEWADAQTFREGDYKIYIPQSFGPPSPYFAREEFVDGINLTQWDELAAQGHDMKAIVKLAAKFYQAQLKEGQALSDIHPGNLAVTKDGRVVVFDRNFYLDVRNGQSRLQSRLVTKNMRALDRMAKKAGFKNLFEALAD